MFVPGPIGFDQSPGVLFYQPRVWRDLQGLPKRFDMPGATCMLHARVSKAGTRRLIHLQLRESVGHAQLCSIDWTSMPPPVNGYTSPPIFGVKHVPGHWGLDLDPTRLRPATIAAADPSHFTLQYHRTAGTVTADGWLQDDGLVKWEVQAEGNENGSW